MAGKNVIELGDEAFDAAIGDTSTPVLVDFWAEWCAPCRRIGPLVEEIANEYAGKLRVAKVNIDQHQKAAGQFDVRSIPTLLLFKDGKVAEKIVGAVPKDQIVQAVQRVV